MTVKLLPQRIRGKDLDRLSPGSAARRLRAASAIRLARRDLVAAFAGPGVYIIITIACLVAGITVKTYLDYVAGNGIIVLSNPLESPLLFAIFVMTGFVGLSAAAGVAGEKERGTLEILFYGPVDAWAYITGKTLGHLAVYVVMAVWLCMYLALSAWITAFPFDPAALGLLILSIVPAGCLIALGQLLAVVTSRVRSALALTLTLLILFFAIDVGNTIVAAQPADSALGSAAQLLSAVAQVTAWLSPFNYLWRAVESINLGSAGDTIANVAPGVIYFGAMAVFSVTMLRRVGVQRWRE